MSARYSYRIRIVRQHTAPAESARADVLNTEVVTTRAGVVAIAARFQKIYPRPAYRVLVYLLERSREPLAVDWEALQEPDDVPR